MTDEFVVESRENLANAEKYLLSLEERSDPETLNALFRTVHSVKGAAGFLEFKSIESLAHVAEELLGQLRDGKRSVDPELVNGLLEMVDLLSTMIDTPDLGKDTDISSAVALGHHLLQSTEKEALDCHHQGTDPELLPLCKEYMKKGMWCYAIFLEPRNPSLANLSDEEFVKALLGELQGIGEIIHRSSAIHNSSAIDQQNTLYIASVLEPAIFIPQLSCLTESVTVIENDESPMSADPQVDTLSAAPPLPFAVVTPPSAPPSNSTIPAPAPATQTIRIGVDVLDRLLDHVGEVVLGRNQFLNNLSDTAPFTPLSQSITKLHQFVIQTRMQPVGTLFERYKRTVRDLSSKLGKKIDLHVEGAEIGLDRTILESLADPLVHLIRNAVDHGIESSEERVARRKSVVGTIYLRALHESGQILIEVEDDGKGIDPQVIAKKVVEKGLATEDEVSALTEKQLTEYIFHPGFSTKSEATEISGRGVGMDVVKSNFEKIGCTVEIVSHKDKGTLVSARIPLTMAVANSSVISALIISISNYTLAIPQLAVNEVIRLSPSEQVKRIEKLKGVEVFKLRDKIIPLVHLEDLLDIERSFYDPIRKVRGTDKRGDLVHQDHSVQERRIAPILFIVLQFKQNLFGILVDKIDGTEEIVVKRLPSILSERSVFAGTTILGSATVAPILDINGMVEKAKLDFMKKQDNHLLFRRNTIAPEYQKIVVFSNADSEYFAVPVNLLSEVDRFNTDEIHRNGPREFIRRHGESIPLLRLENVIDVSPIAARKTQIVLVPSKVSYPTGIVVGRILGTTELTEQINTKESNVKGIMGSIYYNNHLVMLLDIFSLLQNNDPQRYKSELSDNIEDCRVLLVDDQLFFRQLVAQYFRGHGIKNISVTNDGQEALDFLYQNHERIDVVVADIEMPVMNGYQLVSNVKSNPLLSRIPVMALTTLCGEENVRKGIEAGFDAYEVKIDKENVLKALSSLYQSAAIQKG